jgi:hypothetical protein
MAAQVCTNRQGQSRDSRLRVAAQFSLPHPVDRGPKSLRRSSRNRTSVFLLAAGCLLGCIQPVVASSRPSPAPSKTSAVTITGAVLLQKGTGPQLQITASEAIIPRTKVLENPERIVLDFPNAVPAAELRDIVGGISSVSAVRTRLLSRNPPTTRVVLDLVSPRECQVNSVGRQILVSIGPASQQTQLSSSAGEDSGEAAFSAASKQPSNALGAGRRKVTYQSGFLWITAEQATVAPGKRTAENQCESGAGAGSAGHL